MHVKTAIKTAEQQYSYAEQMRRREDFLDEVNRLAEAGVRHGTIAELMGMNERQIVRMCNGQVKAVKAPPRHIISTDANRISRMETMAEAALQLACLQRDEDPHLVWDALLRLDRQALQELTAIALAGIPIDQPKSKIFAWVEEMAS